MINTGLAFIPDRNDIRSGDMSSDMEDEEPGRAESNQPGTFNGLSNAGVAAVLRVL